MADTRDIDETGPQYPPPPAAGSNAIGKFEIGVSPIGDIPAFDWWKTVCSQFANAPALTSIIGRFFAAADQTRDFENFFDDIWNIDTAKDYGLDVWGRIVGVNRVIHLPTTAWFGFTEALPGSLPFDTGVTAFLSPAVGFAEAGADWQPLGWGVFGIHYSWNESGANQGGGAFWSGQALTQNFRLETETYRKLILAKAAFNITDCSIPAINRLLLSLFPNRGNAYVTDGYQGTSYFGFAEARNTLPFGHGVFYSGQTIQGMVMTYTFDFPLTAVEYAIVSQSGVLPKPTGVEASIVVNA